MESITVTIQDIMELLPIVSHKGWSIDKFGKIRDEHDRCPVCSLFNEIDSSMKETAMVSTAERKMNITIDGVYKLMDAADNCKVYADSEVKEIREQLIEILGAK